MDLKGARKRVNFGRGWPYMRAAQRKTAAAREAMQQARADKVQKLGEEASGNRLTQNRGRRRRLSSGMGERGSGRPRGVS